MQLAQIIGTATATVKHPSLHGSCLHVVQPLLADHTSPDGDPQLAINTVSASIGDLVMITSDGRLLRESLNTDATPARWSIIAIVDDLRRTKTLPSHSTGQTTQTHSTPR